MRELMTLFVFCRAHHAPVNAEGLRVAAEHDDGNYGLEFAELQCTGDPLHESWNQPHDFVVSTTLKPL